MADVEKDIVLRVKSETDQATGQFKNLKQELRSIENELNKMASSGQTGSEAFRKLQQRAGEVKDQIGDTKNAIKALSSDTFKLDAFAQGAQGIAGGFAAAQGAMALFGTENKAVEEAIKKTQGAMALLQGVTAITNILQKDSAFSLMFLGKAQKENAVATNIATNATKGFSRALIATGIGAIIVLIGTLVAYWDDLKEAIGGVSQETEKYIETAKKDTEEAEKKYNLTKDTENVLKLQGKSQREILNIKIKETDAIIIGIKNQIKGQQMATKQAVEGAKRNQDIVKGILNVITYPTKLLYKAIDGIVNNLIKAANFFGAGIDFELNLGGTIDQINEFTSSLLFDPEEVAKEGKKTEEELQKSLDKITNEQAGFKLEIQKLDEEALKKQQENDKKAQDEKDKKDAENKKQLEQNAKDFIDRTNKEYEDAKNLSDAYFNHLINQAKLNGEDTTALEFQKMEQLLQIQKDYGVNTTALEDEIALKKKDINDKAAEERKKLDEEERLKSLEADRTYFQGMVDSERIGLQKKLDLAKEYYLQRIISEKEYEDTVTKLNDEAFKKRQENINKWGKLTIDGLNALTELNNAFAKKDEASQRKAFERNKKFSIAQALISTFLAVNGALTAGGNPVKLATGAQFVEAGIALTTGLAQVAKISKTQFQGGSGSEGGGGGVGSVPSPSAMATTTPTIGSTQLQLDAQGNLQQGSVRTYVLETDISDKQKRSKRLSQTATLGK